MFSKKTEKRDGETGSRGIDVIVVVAAAAFLATAVVGGQNDAEPILALAAEIQACAECDPMAFSDSY